MDSPYWTTDEVCRYFRIKRQTLDRWRRQLAFPKPRHHGGHPQGRCMFDKSEVLAWDRPDAARSQLTKRLPDPSHEGDNEHLAEYNHIREQNGLPPLGSR